MHSSEELERHVNALLEAVREATAGSGHSPGYARVMADADTPEDLRQLLLADATDLSSVVNITSLYNQFVSKALDVVREKGNRVPSRRKSSAQETLDRHMLYAASECFRDERLLGMHYVNVQDAVNDLIEDVANEKKVTGGIITDVIDGKPVFIHRTIADYLAALWLRDRHSTVPLITSALYAGEFAEVRFFFDALLADGHPLHEAALSGRVEAVEAALSGEDGGVDALDEGGRAALHLAAIHGHEDVVLALLRHGAGVAARDRIMAWTPLCFADSMVDLSKLRLYRNTAAEFENHLSYLQVVDHLLGAGCNINNSPNVLAERKLVFRIAVENDHANLVKALMEKRYPIFLQRTLNTKYMKIAAEHKSARTVAMLVKCGFKVNVCLEDGKTPLHIFAGDGNEEVCDLLIRHGATVNHKCCRGSTPLHDAATWKQDAVCRLLLTRGAAVNAVDAEGETPLHRAVEQDDQDVCRLLLQCGAKVEGASPCEHTPLQKATLWGHYTIERLLLEHGAKVKDSACTLAVLRGGEPADRRSARHSNGEALRLAREFAEPESITTKL